jgi:hypothetical protein
MIHFFPKRKLSFLEVSLIPEALFSLFIYRLKVSYQPSRKWMPKPTLATAEKIEANLLRKAMLLVKVINGLEKRTPWKNTCLVKALATRSMLKKRKITHKIHIGVAPQAHNTIEAHAWVSVGTEIILEGENQAEFHEISGFQ